MSTKAAAPGATAVAANDSEPDVSTIAQQAAHDNDDTKIKDNVKSDDVDTGDINSRSGSCNNSNSAVSNKNINTNNNNNNNKNGIDKAASALQALQISDTDPVEAKSQPIKHNTDANNDLKTECADNMNSNDSGSDTRHNNGNTNGSSSSSSVTTATENSGVLNSNININNNNDNNSNNNAVNTNNSGNGNFVKDVSHKAPNSTPNNISPAQMSQNQGPRGAHQQQLQQQRGSHWYHQEQHVHHQPHHQMHHHQHHAMHHNHHHHQHPNQAHQQHQAHHQHHHHQQQQQHQQHHELLSKTNLYIKGLELDTSDSDLFELCSRFGQIVSTKAILDKNTNRCKGYGFVDFESPAAADKAVAELQRQGVSAQMAKVQQESDPTNLYIANLPPTMTEEGLESLLTPFGVVVSTRILKDQNDQPRGVGFARMETKDQCDLIISQMNGRTLKGYKEVLLVKFADGPKKARHNNFFQHHNRVMMPGGGGDSRWRAANVPNAGLPHDGDHHGGHPSITGAYDHHASHHQHAHHQQNSHRGPASHQGPPHHNGVAKHHQMMSHLSSAAAASAVAAAGAYHAHHQSHHGGNGGAPHGGHNGPHQHHHHQQEHHNQHHGGGGAVAQGGGGGAGAGGAGAHQHHPASSHHSSHRGAPASGPYGAVSGPPSYAQGAMSQSSHDGPPPHWMHHPPQAGQPYVMGHGQMMGPSGPLDPSNQAALHYAPVGLSQMQAAQMQFM